MSFNLTFVCRAAIGTFELDANLRLGSGFAPSSDEPRPGVSNADAGSTSRGDINIEMTLWLVSLRFVHIPV